MDAQLTLMLGFLAAWLALQLLPIIVVFFQLLRVQLFQLHIERLESPSDFSPDQQAAIDELKALGFEEIVHGQVRAGPRSYPWLLLRHATAPAYAELTLLAAGGAGYPIAFHSFTVDGRMLSTGNRTAWTIFASPDHVERSDPYAATLVDHWKAHLARIPGIAPAAVDNAVAEQRLAAISEGYLQLLRDRHLCVEDRGAWHPSVRAAAPAAWRWFKVRRRLAARYLSAVTDGPHQSAFYARSYAELEAIRASRPARQNIKAFLLILTLLASLLLWGWSLSWSTAIALIVIILVHESGHALAMRLFGYRDMTMFFIPLVGAVVSGTPKNLPAWKQAIVLFAGPVPGLIAGVALIAYGARHPDALNAFDWRAVGGMAIAINLFNLLPLTPLDGGRLVELSLLGRWPGLRVVFATLSVAGLAAVAVWQRSSAFWVFIVFMGLSLLSQFRIATLQRAWRGDLAGDDQVRHLFEVARARLKVQTFARQFVLVKSVMTHRAIHPARGWESAIVITLLIGLWSSAAFLVYGFGSHSVTAARAADTRSAAQKVFDDALDEYQDGDGDPAAEHTMREDAARLDANDPRQVDVQVAVAMQAGGTQRSQALEAVLGNHLEGQHYSFDEIERTLLSDVYSRVVKDPPDLRSTELSEAVDRIVALAPGHEAGLFEGRLRVAEAIDEKGDSAKALAMLDRLQQQATTVDSCRCELKGVIRARAWFEMTHGRSADAVTLLEASSFASQMKSPRGRLSLDYAWALIGAGRTGEGLEQMRRATYTVASSTGLIARLSRTPAHPSRLFEPLDMAYALKEAGRLSESRALITDDNRWACTPYTNGSARSPVVPPWQGIHERALTEMAKEICVAS